MSIVSLLLLEFFYTNLHCFLGWGYDTSVEEVMNNLHNLVAAGKVLYLVSLFMSEIRIL
jgi:aryl-alcohol dehydrogenase-like predicted oxidoreductase